MPQSKYSDLMSVMFEGVYVVDENRKILFWNSGSENITGYKSEEVVGHFCHNNILNHVTADGKHLCFGGCPLHHTLKTGETLSNEVFLQHKNGHRVPVAVRTMPIYDNDKNIVAAIEVFSDSRFRNDMMEENRRLQELVTNDELTGLYNRRYMDYQLKMVQDEFSEFQKTFGILFMDIDHFKQINDTYGHAAGDQVLQLVARTITSNLRAGDYAGRWGGEEFVVLLRNVNAESVFRVAEKLRILISSSSIHIKETNLSVTVSIGATVYLLDEDYKNTVDRADELMYLAKQQGRNRTITDNIKE